MIKVENGRVAMEEYASDLALEFTAICHELIDNGVPADVLNRAIEIASCAVEKRHKEKKIANNKEFNDFMRELMKMVNAKKN